jgi:hypothetical protein
VTLCRPLPYACTQHPSKEDGRTFEKGTDAYPRARTRQRRDVGLVERVSSANSGPVRPSPPLCSHPVHYSAIPVWEPGTTRHHHPRRCASTGLPLATPSNQRTDGDPSRRLPHGHPRSRSRASTGLATTPTGGEIRQDDHQLHGIVCHTTIRSYRTVRHDCKPPPLGL